MSLRTSGWMEWWLKVLAVSMRYGAALTLLGLGAISSGNAASTPGMLYVWGDNTLGQTTPPSNLGKVVSASAGRYHSVAVRSDGTLVTWGTSGDTRLQIPNGLPVIQSVAAGGLHSLALGANGTVYGWGDDSFSQNKPPTSVGTAIAIAAGDGHSLALRANGTVVVWGQNDRGQAPANLSLGGITAIAAGDNHNLALRSDGRVVAWGDNSMGQSAVPNLTGIMAIAAGAGHSLALRNDGRVFAWGDNQSGQRMVPNDVVNVIAIAAGGNCSMALLSNRKVRVWGDSTFSQTTLPSDLTNSLKIAVGSTHCLSIRVDPPVITTQPADRSELSGGTATLTVVATGSDPILYQWSFGNTAIAGATNATLAVTNVRPANVGVYRATLQNSAGTVVSRDALLTVRTPPVITLQPQNLTVTVGGAAFFRVTAEGSSLVYRWRKDGVTVPFGVLSSLAIPLAQLTNAGNYDVVITNVFGSATSAVAVLTVRPLPTFVGQPQGFEGFPGANGLLSVEAADAQTYQWFHDNVPISGANQPKLDFSPIQTSDRGAYKIVIGNPWGSNTSATVNLTLAIPAAFSEVVGWGASQVWNGAAFVNVAPPQGLNGIVQVAAGKLHTIALRKNGTVVGWGDSSHGESVPPLGLNGVTTVAAGDGFSLGLKSDGKVVAWGRSDLGQSIPPASATDITAIAAGPSHALALRRDEQIVAWGSNQQGESTIPPGLGKVTGIAAGDRFNLVLLENGTVSGWGNNDFGQRRPPAGLSNVVSIAAGRAHGAALLANGSVVAWGDNSSGQTLVPALSRPAIGIVAGADHTVAILDDHTVVAWGKNNSGQIEVPTDLQSPLGVAAAGDRSVAIRQHSLKLSSLLSAEGGKIRIQAENVDGTPIDAARATRILLYRSTTLDAPLSAWTVLAAPSLVDGVLRSLDSILITEGAHFYAAIETF